MSIGIWPIRSYLTLVIILSIVVPLVNRLMLPDESESVHIDPALFDERQADADEKAGD